MDTRKNLFPQFLFGVLMLLGCQPDALGPKKQPEKWLSYPLKRVAQVHENPSSACSLLDRFSYNPSWLIPWRFEADSIQIGYFGGMRALDKTTYISMYPYKQDAATNHAWSIPSTPPYRFYDAVSISIPIHIRGKLLRLIDTYFISESEPILVGPRINPMDSYHGPMLVVWIYKGERDYTRKSVQIKRGEQRSACFDELLHLILEINSHLRDVVEVNAKSDLHKISLAFSCLS